VAAVVREELNKSEYEGGITIPAFKFLGMTIGPLSGNARLKAVVPK
jgi:hypothetical protein